MSALSRFGPTIARAGLLQHQRHMASASAVSDPVQRLFVEKIKEFKSTNKGLDAAHEKVMAEEMLRLKRVYNVDDESKLAQMEYKFSDEAQVTLHDIDENKERRAQIASGEYQKKLAIAKKQTSTLMSSIPEQVTHDLHLPPLNHPNIDLILEQPNEAMKPYEVGESIPDYETPNEKVTPEKLERDMLVRFGPEMPTINDDKSPERDAVNFPRQPIELDTPPTRFHVIPESWFQFFYPKTGVTGPYVFAASFTTFLLSKEWLVWEHELLTGVTSTMILAWAITKFGPKVSEYIKKEVNTVNDGWEHWRLGNIDFLEKNQEHYRNELKKSDTIEDIYSIRAQDVELQVEGEYRNRIKTVYDDTRRRLNYLVSVADSQRQIAHKNMVNWVITNAISSIGQKQENEVLDSCIVNLKQLAVKNSNAI